MSFDVSHDRDLKERLLVQLLESVSSCRIVGCSEDSAISDSWMERVRRRIDGADEVIFICGEKTGMSTQVGLEIEIAQAQQKPYFLLWGRRGVMCTRPIGAKPDDSMYSWTTSYICEQISATLRSVLPREIPEHLIKRR
jgi:hypothetical protein